MRRGRALPVLALLLAGMPAMASEPGRDEALHAFLRERFADMRGDDPSTRYASGWADLDGDNRMEAFVYFMSPAICGSGGCDLYIFTPEQNSFQQLAHMTVTRPPVRVLRTRTDGWHDISVTIGGGGVRGGSVLLRQQGGTYPGNPTDPPARMLRQAPPGEIVIAEDDRGRPLFE